MHSAEMSNSLLRLRKWRTWGGNHRGELDCSMYYGEVIPPQACHFLAPTRLLPHALARLVRRRWVLGYTYTVRTSKNQSSWSERDGERQ